MSCLFNSLSFFIQENSYNIRPKICDYLEENKPIIYGLETSFFLNLENILTEEIIKRGADCFECDKYKIKQIILQA